eukprot:m.7830 g.7830  ORF g.7830 m.7830 type:complete len:301 (-) comp5922_c0_seq1:2130-3032(-)
MSCTVIQSPEKDSLVDGMLEPKRCKVLQPFNKKDRKWIFRRDNALRKQAVPRRGLSTGFFDIPLSTGKPRFGNGLRRGQPADSDEDDEDEDSNDDEEDSDTDAGETGEERRCGGIKTEGNKYNFEDSDSDDECLTEFRRKKFAHLSVHNQHFNPQSKAEPIENFIFKKLKKKKRRLAKREFDQLKKTKSTTSSSSSSSQATTTTSLSNSSVATSTTPSSMDVDINPPYSMPVKRPNKVNFSLKEVLAIVESAVRSREADLREEYGAVLALKLREQHQQYRKYTEDFMHKKMEESSFSYCS